VSTDQTFVFALKREVDKADAFHLASLKTAEQLAQQAVTAWCTNQTSAAAIMESIVTWSQQMQTALKARQDLPALPPPAP
jgi:hypothetical protein